MSEFCFSEGMYSQIEVLKFHKVRNVSKFSNVILYCKDVRSMLSISISVALCSFVIYSLLIIYYQTTNKL